MYSIREDSTKIINHNSCEFFLKSLVDIDSQVSNNNGILKVQELLAKKFQELGFTIKLIPNSVKDTPPLLFAKKFIHQSNPTISFIGHSDVVTSPKRNEFKIEGDRIYGSGVADDKGGISVCVKAIEDFLISTLKFDLNLNILISPNEETGSIGFHHIFKEVGKESDYILGLEPALHTGSIISSRSGNRWYNFKVKGIAAHAGRFGQPHINAAHTLSLLIAKLHELNNEDELRRINVGSFHGGNGGFNTICDSANAKIDTRFSNFQCRDYLHQRIEEIMESTIIECPYSYKKSSILYSIEDDCPPLGKLEQEIPWFSTILRDISSLENREINDVHAGGAADINYFSLPGKKLIDGLGPVGGGLHTNQEYIERSTLITRSKAIQNFLHTIQNTHNLGGINVL